MLVSATVLFDQPLILFVGDTFDAPLSSASLLAEPLRDREVVFILMTTWSAENTPYGEELAAFVKAQERRYPLHDYLIFSNTAAEVAFFRSRRVRAFLGHHNTLVDPRIYKPVPDSPKDLLAVHTACLVDWKRHHLAEALPSVGIIYWNRDAEALAHLALLKGRMPQARFINEELPTPHACLPKDEVAAVLSRARVGLCLSAEEGGMHASIEYLLVGLPIVSTPSKGGRDFFFHEDYVEIAEPTAAAVAAAVTRVLSRAPPAAEIRARTMALQHRQILAFVDVLDTLVKAGGGPGFSMADWDRRYVDKLIHVSPVEDFLRALPPGRTGASLRRRLISTRNRVKRLVRA